MSRRVIVELSPYNEITQVLEDNALNRSKLAAQYGVPNAGAYNQQGSDNWSLDYWAETDSDTLYSEGVENGSQLSKGYRSVIKQIYPVVQS